jgi:hypothetical protein
MRSAAISITVTGLAVAFLCIGCGGGDETKPPPNLEPVELHEGQMGVIAGIGSRATDPGDGDPDGILDPPIPALRAKFDSPLDVEPGPDGRLYLIDWNGHKIRALDENGDIAFIAGTGIEGDACEALPEPDGCPGFAAEMNHPTGLAFDAQGRMIVAAWHNSKIKLYDPETRLVRDICGTGKRNFEGDGGPCKADGADLVSMDLPSSVAIDDSGNIFFSDQANQIIRRIGTDGIVTTVVGNCPGTGGKGCPAGQGYSGDGGPAVEAALANRLGQGTDPQGKMAFDSAGVLYIADSANHVIRKVVPGSDGIIGDGDPAEEIITTIAGTGEEGFSGDGGPATEAQLYFPTDVAIDADGTVYIADRANSCVRRVDPSGTITTAAGRCGSKGDGDDGIAATEAELNNPYGVALDGRGGLYVADTLNHCIRKVLLSE